MKNARNCARKHQECTENIKIVSSILGHVIQPVTTTERLDCRTRTQQIIFWKFASFGAQNKFDQFGTFKTKNLIKNICSLKHKPYQTHPCKMDFSYAA